MYMYTPNSPSCAIENKIARGSIPSKPPCKRTAPISLFSCKKSELFEDKIISRYTSKRAKLHVNPNFCLVNPIAIDVQSNFYKHFFLSPLNPALYNIQDLKNEGLGAEFYLHLFQQ